MPRMSVLLHPMSFIPSFRFFPVLCSFAYSTMTAFGGGNLARFAAIASSSSLLSKRGSPPLCLVER